MDLVLSCVAIVGLLITVGKVLDDSWDLKTKEELSLRLFKCGSFHGLPLTDGTSPFTG